jgi:hypothetical protein
MTRPPEGLRNGLKWRNGHPRWEPAPANRAAGIKGRDLKHVDGRWVADRGLAISLCDDRLAWARRIREALQNDTAGLTARDLLTRALTAIDAALPPVDDDGRLRRANIADLIEKGRALLEDRPERTVAAAGAGRTVADLVDAYFQDPPGDVTASTLKAYRAQKKKIDDAFGNRPVRAVTQGEIYTWYHKTMKPAYGLATCNLAYGFLAAIFKWAGRHDWLTGQISPVRDVGAEKSEGRLVTWSWSIEEAFVDWCDGNGFEDVGDAVTYGCWTGARQIDMCAAAVGDLGATWHYRPVKTQRKSLEAIAGILPIVSARVERRRVRAQGDGARYLRPDQAPLLWYASERRRHDSDSIGARFAKARAECAAANQDERLAGIADLRLQDTRDTCVTRLFYACDMDLKEICPWTGHSLKSAERILRMHYISLRREGAERTAAKYLAYATAQGINL